MIVQQYNNRNEWLEGRRAKITGSGLNDTYAARGGHKIGFYQLIADRLAIVDDTDEAGMDRGHRLEVEAVEALNEARKLKLIPSDNAIWISDINPDIAVSPDAHNKTFTEAAEVKCLKAALHIQAIIENKIYSPGYRLQALQYFVVNEKLKTLYFVFYNPNVTSRPLHVIEMKRADFAEDIAYYEQYEIDTLKEINKWVEELAF
jgi:hypothetical protein